MPEVVIAEFFKELQPSKLQRSTIIYNNNYTDIYGQQCDFTGLVSRLTKEMLTQFQIQYEFQRKVRIY